MNNGFVMGKVNDFESSRGYFIGQFMAKYGRQDLVTDLIDIGWKKLTPDFKEIPHYHKIGIDINIIISGHVTTIIAGKKYELYPRDFLIVYPPTVLDDYIVHEDTEVIVIKSPSVTDDKYNL
mgnify:CR=1 FL=1